jgi:hypothetical protein
MISTPINPEGATRLEICMKTLHGCLVLGALALAATTANARVHFVNSTQSFAYASPDFSRGPRNVAIDGDSAIAILERTGGRSAVLFQRGADGQWAQTRTLLDVTTSSTGADQLAMADGVAAIRIADVLHVFERTGTNWVESSTAGTPRPAFGLATSAHRILSGRRGCNYDANVYAKSQGSGVWGVAGRASGAIGECNDHGAGLDLEGDVALVINSPNEIREYRRNGSNFDWPQVGTITAPSGVNFYPYPNAPALHADVAVTANGHYFRRTGGAWDYQGHIEPLNSAQGTSLGSLKFGGGLLASISSQDDYPSGSQPYLFRQNLAGAFDQVAILATETAAFVAVSGNTAVASCQDDYDRTIFLRFFTLPTPIVAPDAVANDFEARDVSDIQQSAGSGFALVNSGANYVYRQSATGGESHAVLTHTDWTDYQFIEADITPTAFDGNDRWFGLAVRYVDENNFYYVTLRSSGKLQIRRKINGVFTTLAERTLPVSAGTKYHVSLDVWEDGRLDAVVYGVTALLASDTGLKHGRAALMTYRTRADFDNVYAAPTLALPLVFKQPGSFSGGAFTYEGGRWEWTEVPDDYPDDVGESQLSTSGDARAYFGTPTDNQRIDTSIRLDAYNASPSGAWFGVLARWVDARNYYYLSIRSTGRLEIRKQLNGVVTVLKSVPFAAQAGRFYKVRFEVLGNELHAFVDGAFVAGAIDGDIASGKYGLGSYRSAFTYQTVEVHQP